MHDHQRRRLNREPPPRPDVDALLTTLRTLEEENSAAAETLADSRPG
jgi:hypothetical protein